ncbi:hypothetical protein IR083_00860 [Dysgonomonas sp. GY75]|uniref:hypothetical protein n=1 Tax=Dysgonomonas sp. GY75 TaxID=2780419 RepID=UPI001883FFF2|nr:hypothetical protein [Dysgonomonas sp. GY75]MBF0647369.1 hypothetical protein [Dysgonomonas sp. GY75]
MKKRIGKKYFQIVLISLLLINPYTIYSQNGTPFPGSPPGMPPGGKGGPPPGIPGMLLPGQSSW